MIIKDDMAVHESINNLLTDLLFRVFKKSGYELYAVGGCVRDALLGNVPKDIDFCTNAAPEEMRKVFDTIEVDWAGEFSIIPTGEAYGTLTIYFYEYDERFEITTYRIDGAYSDNRHPDSVEFAPNIKDDLARRDFTCNAIAYSPYTGIYDPFDGVEDLKNKVIRCVGDPQSRFNEDALRLFRLVRFALRYGFNIDKKTCDAALDFTPAIRYVSKERIGKELTEIFKSKIDISGHTYMLLVALLREITCRPTKLRNAIDIRTPLLRWIRWFDDDKDSLNLMAVGKEIVSGVLNVCKAIDYTIDNLGNNINQHKRVLGWLQTKDELDAYIEFLSINKFDEICGVIVGAIVRDEPVKLGDLAINGTDIMKHISINSGKEVGEILECCLNNVLLNEKLNTKEQLLKIAELKHKGMLIRGSYNG